MIERRSEAPANHLVAQRLKRDAHTGREAARSAADARTDEAVAPSSIDVREGRLRRLVRRARPVVALADVVTNPRVPLPCHADVVAAKQEAGRLGDVVEMETRNALVPRKVVLRRQEEPVDAFDARVFAVRLAEVAELGPSAAVLDDASVEPAAVPPHVRRRQEPHAGDADERERPVPEQAQQVGDEVAVQKHDVLMDVDLVSPAGGLAEQPVVRTADARLLADREEADVGARIRLERVDRLFEPGELGLVADAAEERDGGPAPGHLRSAGRGRYR